VGEAEGGVPFDADGMIASEGGVVRAVVDRYLAKPFFDRAGPKSLDRNDFTLDLGRWGWNSPTARARWLRSRPRRS
jgi:1,6-anhydro-N-acetylmuramate kinase